MHKAGVICIALLLLPLTALSGADDGGKQPSDLMPHVEDYTHMWWAAGFPSHIPAAPWRRVIQTGTYALALDTETMRIPHFGRVPEGIGYAECARSDSNVWERLPPAELSLAITVNGKRYRCTAGGKWGRSAGPRLIESGRFVQRADVTGLVFSGDDRARLIVDARFETVAWPDRLGLILAVRPGLLSIPAGQACFGRIGGGFGFDGANSLQFPHSPELDPEQFTVEFWAFVPGDYKTSERARPWLVCKNGNDTVDGNYGIALLSDRAQARLNIGGGRRNAFTVDGRQRAVKTDTWNHIAMSYDGDVLRLYVNGREDGSTRIGRRRVPGVGGLAFGCRQDERGDGGHFRGAIDEIKCYDRALSASDIRGRFTKPDVVDQSLKPVREWSFRADGMASMNKPYAQWKDVSMEVRLAAPDREWRQRWELPKGETWKTQDWREVAVVVSSGDIETMKAGPAKGPGLSVKTDRLAGSLLATSALSVNVRAAEIPGGAARKVTYDQARGWHCVNLDGIVPLVPAGGVERQNDSMERVRLVISNPSDREQTARLLFAKNEDGFRQRIGVSITGVSVCLRDKDGYPTGIPVQLSKNWHSGAEGGVYAGPWFHAFSQVRLQARSTAELELTLSYGHWGGVAAASHSQLCLIGWGGNQLWDESALGSWGESICYDPDQAQARASILDARPLMVSTKNRAARWSWTHNVGGGDYCRLFDTGGSRVYPSGMHTTYKRLGPCLTEVTYAGHTGPSIAQSATVSLARSDDVVRGVYRLRFDVIKPVDFTRFVIFQIGADTYSQTAERKMALGNEKGLIREWATQLGGDVYRTQPMECVGTIPWISLHEAVPRLDRGEKGAWANRGIVIRSWKARLGGKDATPWLAERGVSSRVEASSTADIVPPPGCTRFEAGDFVEATVEHIIMPQFAKDYYGPSEDLRAALGQWENTWRMIYREAAGNDWRVEVKNGTLENLHPAVTIHALNGEAEFTLSGGLGYIPVTFSGLDSPRDQVLFVDGQPLDQSVHGRDFWQTDYDAVKREWSVTYNIPAGKGRLRVMRLARLATGANTRN